MIAALYVHAPPKGAEQGQHPAGCWLPFRRGTPAGG